MTHKSIFSNNQNNFFVAIIILGAFLRVVCFLLSGNTAGDAAARALIGLEWMLDPKFLPNPIWLPFHSYMIGGALYLWNDPVIVPRLLSLVLGIMSLFPFYGLVRLEFGKKAALISTLLFSVYPFHIRHSVVSLGEVPTLFFILSSLYFFLYYLKEDSSLKYLGFSTFFLNVACMIRAEAWFFIPVLTAILAYKSSLRRAVLFLFLSSILLLTYAIVSKIQLGVFIPYIQLIPRRPRPPLTLISPFRWMLPPYISLTPLVFLLCLVGLCRAVIQKSHAIFALIILAPLIPVVKLFAGGNTQPRYTLHISVLLLPFLTIGYAFVRDIFPHKFRKVASVVTIGLLLVVGLPRVGRTIYHGSSHYSPIVSVPGYVTQIAEWIKKTVGKDEKIILDEDKNRWWGLNILLMGRPEGWEHDTLRTQTWPYPTTEDAVFEFIETEKPKWLLYSPRGRLSEIFSSIETGKEFVYKGHSFRRIPYNDSSNYRIFEIDP